MTNGLEYKIASYFKKEDKCSNHGVVLYPQINNIKKPHFNQLLTLDIHFPTENNLYLNNNNKYT